MIIPVAFIGIEYWISFVNGAIKAQNHLTFCFPLVECGVTLPLGDMILLLTILLYFYELNRRTSSGRLIKLEKQFRTSSPLRRPWLPCWTQLQLDPIRSFGIGEEGDIDPEDSMGARSSCEKLGLGIDISMIQYNLSLGLWTTHRGLQEGSGEIYQIISLELRFFNCSVNQTYIHHAPRRLCRPPEVLFLTRLP